MGPVLVHECEKTWYNMRQISMLEGDGGGFADMMVGHQQIQTEGPSVA
jgi:hypothetical protein